MAMPKQDNNTTVLPFDKPSASVVYVSPDIAKRWLNSNTANRNVRPSHVAKLARDMEAGDWLLTGEAVKFNHQGKVLDGQHRLHAVVESGTTVPMFVVRGLDDSAQSVMDSGAARSAGDNLGLRGYKNAALLAATARIVLRQRHGGASWNYEPSHAEIYAILDEQPDLMVAANMAQRYAKHVDIRPAVVAFTTWLIGSRVGYERAEEFWESAAFKVGLTSGDPVLAMTASFTKARMERRNIDIRAQVSAIVRMYNARRQGSPVRIVKFVSPGGNAGHVPIPRVVTE